MPATTYPGTANPLRGLTPFSESERDVLFGRDHERDELSRLVSGDGFRAGLLYGDPGVGKTSLLRAGVVPHLRDHGVIALFCENPRSPAESLAAALTAASGSAATPGEPHLGYLSRVLGSAMANQLFLFIVDDAESVLDDDHVVGELGDMFARVVARSNGRARFLFGCSSQKVHLFGRLERRTGSLFPPSSRFELLRFSTATAAVVLDRTLTLAGVDADQGLAQGVATGLGEAILPADIQITASAIRELGLRHPDELARLGGAVELERLWLTRAAASTGNERSALRLLAELAHGEGTRPVSPEWAANRASLDPAWSRQALTGLAERGVVRQVSVHGEGDFYFVLSHQILAPRIREVAAPARETARRAFELLGSKAAQNKRLSPREWLAVQREGLAPSTPAERAVLDRTRQVARIAAAAAVGVPLLILIVIYFAMSGNYYLDVARSPSGVDTVVVRAGRPGLMAFSWLPGSPDFGSVVADSGYRQAMVNPEAWKQITDHDIGGDGDDYVAAATAALSSELRDLIAYATDGSESALDALVKAAQSPEQKVRLLEGLAAIGRGGAKEVGLIEQSLLDDAPSVQTAALTVAAETARRRPDLYQDTLAGALGSADAELRRLAFSAVRSLGPDAARALFQRALADNQEDGPARQELLAVVSAATTEPTESPATAAAILANPAASAATRERAREILTRAFRTHPAEATKAATALIVDERAPIEEKRPVFQMLLERAPKDSYPELAEALRTVTATKDEAVRAAALPLSARVAPEQISGELALLVGNTALSDEMRTAMALAWGETVRGGAAAAPAATALTALLADRKVEVRVAAASAYGYLGRPAQEELNKMVKKERFDVAVGAMYGLAHSAEVGGNTSNAVYGIAQMWKKKGKPRREAARVYADLARTRPAPVFNYLSLAARIDDDPGLHPIGVDGLCNAIGAGHKAAARELARSVDDASVEVRRKVIECVADNPAEAATAIRIATKMATDRDATIRAEVARVLSQVVARGEPPDDVKQSLVVLAKDDVRDVRVLALAAIEALGAGAPEEAREVLPRAFAMADETEKLVVLETAQAIGAGGLVQLAIADPSPLVREAGLDTAIATGSAVPATMASALTDPDPGLRRAALERLAAGKHGLGPDDVDRALALASRDRDESIRDQALTTLARLGEIDKVKVRLAATITSRSERERARAAAALAGLTARKPEVAAKLLEPLLADPSHDVRAAMLPALASAWAKLHPPKELAKLLRGSEGHATRRLVAAAAFVVLADTEKGKEAATDELERLAKEAGPFGRGVAKLTLGLIASSANGVQFLARLTP